MKTLFRWLNKFLLGWTVLLYFLPRVRWEEKRSMPKGPVLLVSNHKNHMDFLLLMAVFYFRYLRCLVGKTFYESSGAMHFLLRMLGAIKVDRFSFDMDFFYECMDALQKGQTLLIFPEENSPWTERCPNSTIPRRCWRCRRAYRSCPCTTAMTISSFTARRS